MNNIIIALNGILVGNKKEYHDLIDRNNSFIIAADGGANLLAKLNFLPDIVIGDLDSLTNKKIEDFKKMNIEVIEYPIEKNETDGELALTYCKKKGYDKVSLIGAVGGRYDQQLANVFLVEYALKNNINAQIREPGLEIGLIDNFKKFNNKKNWGLSLIPLDRRVKSVSIDGCKYKLESHDLVRHKTRGISNLIVENSAVVTHGKGRLLYILDKNK